jgi:hypothetical protein
MPQDLTDYIFEVDRTETVAIDAVGMGTQDVDFAGSRGNAFDAFDHNPIMWMVKYDHIASFQEAHEDGDFPHQDVIPLLKKR